MPPEALAWYFAPMDGTTSPRDFNVVVERDEDGFYIASVPSLPGCHTQAKSLDDLMERIKEAIALYVEDEGDTHPRLEFIGIQRVTLPA